jgi:hypothetical protein
MAALYGVCERLNLILVRFRESGTLFRHSCKYVPFEPFELQINLQKIRVPF